MLCDALMLSPLVNAYSLRRGGATWGFFKHGSMETTLLRGRWQSSAATRVYVSDAAAAVVDYSLNAHQRALLTEAGALLLGLGADSTGPVW